MGGAQRNVTEIRRFLGIQPPRSLLPSLPPERGMADFEPPAPESLALRPLARRIVALQRAYELVSSVDSPEWDLAALREVLRLAAVEESSSLL